MAAATAPLGAGEAAPPTILSTAVAAAEKVAMPRLPKEENLTDQSYRLTQLAALLVRAGRTEQALRLIDGLKTEDSVRVPAYVPLAVAAIEARDEERVRTLVRRVSSLDEWTTPVALADIALAMRAAGDEAGALRLAREIADPAEQTRVFLALNRFEEAIPAAAAIRPASIHVPYAGGSRWELDYDGALAALLKLVTAFVDRGDLGGAHRAMDAIAEVADRDTHAYHARALLEVARREPALPTLRKALAEVELDTGERPGERRDSAELLARIAEALDAAGDRTLALSLLPKAVALMGPTGSVAELEMAPSIVAEALERVARAHLALGQRQEALALLDRAARLADLVPLPARRTPKLSWDDRSSAHEDRVAILARVAAELEAAGETRRAEEVLRRALTGLDGIPASEWREYAWRAVFEAYAGAGRLDRALDVLASGPPANPDKYLALTVVPDDALLAAGRERRWRLLAALAPGWAKVELEARLAARLEAQGDGTEASLVVADALASLGTDDWEWPLIRLATLAPGVDRPGDAGQQRVLRALLDRLPR